MNLVTFRKCLRLYLVSALVLGFKVENNTELCLQGAHRQMGEIDQHMVIGKTKCGTVSMGWVDVREGLGWIPKEQSLTRRFEDRVFHIEDILHAQGRLGAYNLFRMIRRKGGKRWNWRWRQSPDILRPLVCHAEKSGQLPQLSTETLRDHLRWWAFKKVFKKILFLFSLIFIFFLIKFKSSHWRKFGGYRKVQRKYKINFNSTT